MEPAAGTKFGAYRIGRRLGEGGMGAVWEATHEGLQKRVAIKTLHTNVATNAEAVSRFVREGRAASRIHHQHIVDVTDVGVHEGTPYLVMEYLDGEPLSALMARTGALAIETIVAIALPTMDALHAAHAAGVVHRDLKPDNIFLRRSPTQVMDPVVLDFGISKLDTGQDARLTRTASLMGTPYYMSPEQARGAKHVDARSDQFALGLVLFEMAAGQRAVDGESVLEIVHKIAQVEFPKLSTLRPELPVGFAAVIERMLASKAEDRFASLKEVGAALLPFADPTARAMWSRSFGAEVGFAATMAGQPEARASVAAPIGTPPPGTPSTFRQMSRESLAPKDEPPSRVWMLGGVAILALAILALAWPSFHATPVPVAVALPTPPTSVVTDTAPPSTEATTTAAPEPFTLRVGSTPVGASVSLDGAPLGTAPVVHTLERDGVPHVLEIVASGYIPQRIEFLDIAPVEHVSLERIPRGHRGPVEARTSVMTAQGLVPVEPSAAPAPEVPTVADVEPEAPSVRATPPRERRPSTPRDDVPEGEQGANGSLIIR